MCLHSEVGDEFKLLLACKFIFEVDLVLSGLYLFNKSVVLINRCKVFRHFIFQVVNELISINCLRISDIFLRNWMLKNDVDASFIFSCHYIFFSLLVFASLFS